MEWGGLLEQVARNLLGKGRVSSSPERTTDQWQGMVWKDLSGRWNGLELWSTVRKRSRISIIMAMGIIR